MDRIERIRAKRLELDAQAVKEQEERNARVEYFTKSIKDLAPRIKELIKVGIELRRNGLSLGSDNRSRPNAEEFVTEGIMHKLGYVVNDPYWKRTDIPSGIGIEGGGCAGYDLFLDEEGDITSNPLHHVIGCRTRDDAYKDFCWKAERFLKEFDEFEKKVYEYVDNL